MNEGSPSKTALGAAIRRAEHQLLDVPPVLEDPLAMRIIGAEEAKSIQSRRAGPDLQRSRYMRAFIAARSRYAEDQLGRAVASGASQYVVLGAGLDTFAYRNPYVNDGLRVFEVDRPSTQAWKRDRLALTGISIPRSLTFVGVDFESQRLDVELESAGFELGEAACFSWLGVTPYLSHDAVLATLALIHSLHPDNTIVFDYARPREALSGVARLSFDALSDRVGLAGEPFRCFFETERLVGELRDIGYARIEHPTSEEINDLYFRDRQDGLQLRGRLGGLICAG